MKKNVIGLFIMLVVSIGTFGQLTGIKTIPGSYPTINAAIFTLNAQGVGAGGVTFNIAAGYTETFPILTTGLITTNTGSAANPIVFQKSGSGANPMVTAAAGTASDYEYIFCLQGCDYVTFDGIDVADPAGLVEWGYALLKSSGTDGSQHVTIRNCNITMVKYNPKATFGIYSGNVTPSAPSVQLTVTSANGANSYDRFYNNTIQNSMTGIYLSGYNDANPPYAYYDQSNEIGKDGMNAISDFGAVDNSVNLVNYGIYTAFQNNQVIANNSITGPSAGTGTCSGIYLGTSSNSRTNMYGNTVSVDYYGTGPFYGIYNNMGGNFTDNTYNCYNNTVTNCTYPDAGGNLCHYMNNNICAATINIYNNQVTNNTYGSGSGTATGDQFGIYTWSPTNTPSALYYYGNSVTGNSRFQMTPAAGRSIYMYIGSGGAVPNAADVHDNVVSNNTSEATGYIRGMQFANGAFVKTFYNNTVTDLTAGGIVTGISVSTGYSITIYNNKVQNLTSTGSNVTVTGMEMNGATSNGPLSIYNNIIAELKAPNSSSASSLAGMAVESSATNSIGIYNNTVYLDGTSAAMGFGSIAMNLGHYTKTFDLRNNIFVNNATPTGGGKTIALYVDNLNALNLDELSDRNDYYAGVPGTNNLIFSDGTNNDQTLEAFKMRVLPREIHSVSELPPFIQAGTSPYDLHINPAIPTQCESSGVVISIPNYVSITDDMDGNPRFPNAGYPNNPSFPATAPDLGADEFGGIALDVSAPVIIFDALTNTASLTGQVLTATITDASGVPVSGAGLPRVAWKKFFNGTWNYSEGVTAGNDQYTFTFGSGAALGDSVYYYVIAQDNAQTPNVGTMPMAGSAGFSANPPAAVTHPRPLYFYKVVQGVCGTLQVGTGQTYATLSAAISDINNKALTCPTTLLLTDNSYTAETYPIIINRIAGASAVNTLTIKPAPGKTPVFSTSYVGVFPATWSMISLNGTRYLTIDGSASGGTDRSLTLENAGTGGFVAVIGLYNDGKTGASNITIKNCVIKSHSEAMFNTQCIVTYNILGDAGYSNIVIDNNLIHSAKYPVQILGIGSRKTRNVQVTNNTIGSLLSSEAFGNWGVFLNNTDNVLIQGNEIIGPAQGIAALATICGIAINPLSTNTKIRKNIIHDCKQLYASTGAAGIFYYAEATSLTEITDNVIYNISAPGNLISIGKSGNTDGIMIQSGGNVNIWHNTISLSGNFLTADNNAYASCLTFGEGVNMLDIRDNILKNSSQPIAPSGFNLNSYCIAAGANAIFTLSNNNDYFTNGVGAAIGYYNGANRTTLADWQGATGQDANSVNVDPVFTSSTNYKPTTTAMNKAGVYIPVLPADLAGVARTNPPDIGAYEYSVSPVVVTSPATSVTANSATLNGTVNPSAFNTYMFFDYGPTNAYGTSVHGTPYLVYGSSLLDISTPLTGLAANTTYHFRIRAVTFSGLTVYGGDKTFTTPPGIPENITVSGTVSGVMDTCYNASNTITVAGGESTFDVQAGGSASFIAWQKISFLPGTTVQQGGYLHGYISYGTYCGSFASPMVATAAGDQEEKFVSGKGAGFMIYPNPTTGKFTLAGKGDRDSGSLQVEIFNLTGSRVLSQNLAGEASHEFDVSGIAPGIYFVKVIADGNTETIKLVKE